MTVAGPCRLPGPERAPRRIVQRISPLAIMGACALMAGSGDRTHASAEEGAPPATPLVEYASSGGFAGLQDQLVIRADGSAVATRKGQGRELHLDPGGLARLKSAFETAQFVLMKKEYLARGSDLFTYKVTYQGRTVTAMDTAVPGALEPLLSMLNAIVDSPGEVTER